MRRRFNLLVSFAVVMGTVAAAPVVLLTTTGAGASTSGTGYTPGGARLATITDGTSAAPWNEYQGDLGYPTYSNQSPGTVLPTYTPGGATSRINNGVSGAAVTAPNLSVMPGAASGTDGVAPYPSGVVGTAGPLDGYCGTGTATQEAAGSPVRQPADTTLPLAPAYFPHIVRNGDGSLTGYFDYRPKDADEAIVAAASTDNGQSWTYDGEALEQNPGYCPSADTNDDGQGHPNVITVGGVSRLYTLPRAAGDNIGVGMLVHALDPTAADPLNGLPTSEKTGVDPDDFASAAVAVPHTGGSAVTITFTNPIGSGPEALVAGEFVDLTQTPVPTAASVINCAAVGTSSIGTCTTTGPSGIAVQPGDLIEQVIATITGNLAASSPATACGSGSSTPTATGTGALPCTVPTGPNTTNGDGGLEGFNISAANANNLTMAIFNANAPNRGYIDGVAIYCNQSNALPTTKIENCTTGPGGGPLTVNAGDPVTSDPIVPATAEQTSGLIAPDGIVGVLPSYPGAPAGATVVMYTEKVLNYYIVGYTGGATKFAANMSIAFTTFPGTGAVSLGSGPTYTVSVGDNTTDAIIQERCSGLTTNATGGTLTGCNGGTVGDAIAKNSYLGGPGAATVAGPTLAQTAEGSATNAQKLLKNNEDETVLRVAYTTDGVTFSSAGLANNGVISGASNGASNYQDINNPSLTVSPSNLNAYASPGTADATEMRFVGSAGSIIVNPDGSYGLFLSGAWAADGDSDAFNQIFYSSSTDGENWTVPVSVVSTDYTFSASIAQDQALAGGRDQPIGVSAYYSGRAYGPSVVQNPDGTLTMVFAGYRLPKTIANAGTTLGTGSQKWTIGADDPTMYRSILVDTLQSATTPAVSTTTTGTVAPASLVLGQTLSDSATVGVVSPGTGTPTGTVSFFACGSTAAAEPCTSQATEVGSAIDLTTGAGGAAATSASFTPTGAGEWCVAAYYSGDANYAASSDTEECADVAAAGTTTATAPTRATITLGAADGDTATVTGNAAGGSPTGTVTFYQCGPTVTPEPCTSTPDPVGGPIGLVAGAGDTATATSASFTPDAGGFWCFAASYSGDGNYTASSDTTTDECFDVPPVITSAGTVTFVEGEPATPFQVTSSGGSNPVTYTERGTLPSGVTLSLGGVLSGTPGFVGGQFPITITATDAGGSTGTQGFTLYVLPSSVLHVTTTSLPAADHGVGYQAQLSAAGGSTPYRWSITSGHLPGGLRLNAKGAISGTPKKAAVSETFTVQVKDKSHQTATATFTITVS
jgi:hypothetical protein